VWAHRIVAPSQLSVLFGAELVSEPLPPRYNVAPGAQIYAVAGTRRGRRIGTMSWGLVPSWSEGPRSGPRPINARAETLLERPVFAEALARRRCLVPADGFYEWRELPQGAKQPYFITARDGTPLAIAGLWDRWRSPDGEGIVSVALVTTSANAVVADLHDRMPAILPPSAWEAWLGPATVDPAALQELLRPAPPELLKVRPISPRVNSVANDGPELLEAPVQAVPT
jgi:putative SOS response-associated peptidase YedK